MEVSNKFDKKIKSVELKPIESITATQFYMDVRNGKRNVTYLHKDLESILRNSNGVFIYQEDVMKFLVDIVGYTWEESDLIRSAIAKKKHNVIMATFDKIRESCSARGWSQENIEIVCKQIQAFARYSFNKSHAHAYAELGYITMYLKNKHPLEWWTCILNNHIDSEVKMRKDMILLGDLVKPPSLIKPTLQFVINESKEIISPISAIKGIGPKAVEELVEKGPFTSIEDFVERVNHRKVNIGAVSALIKARAADCLMDESLPYQVARKTLMDEYQALRKKKQKTFYGKFRSEMEEMDPVALFLQEREANKAFNKTLLGDYYIKNIIINKWSGLQSTGKSGIPFFMRNTPVLRDIDVAIGFLNKGYEKEVGMILFYEGSEVKSGISKKSGKPYSMTKIKLSDGYNTIEAIKWDKSKPLKWDKNSIVYIRGTLKEGWQTPVSLNMKEFERIE